MPVFLDLSILFLFIRWPYGLFLFIHWPYGLFTPPLALLAFFLLPFSHSPFAHRALIFHWPYGLFSPPLALLAFFFLTSFLLLLLTGW